MVLSNLNVTVEPAATGIVSLAVRGLLLQVMAPDVTASTGVLFNGWRTAALDWRPPAMTVVKMSVGV
jgi:hypothetical protein